MKGDKKALYCKGQNNAALIFYDIVSIISSSIRDTNPHLMQRIRDRYSYLNSFFKIGGLGVCPKYI